LGPYIQKQESSKEVGTKTVTKRVGDPNGEFEYSKTQLDVTITIRAVFAGKRPGGEQELRNAEKKRRLPAVLVFWGYPWKKSQAKKRLDEGWRRGVYAHA